MKRSLKQLLLLLGCCCALTQVTGCVPQAGRGTVPNWRPGQPIGVYNPQPYPGAVPRYPVSYPPFSGTPVAVIPNPFPGTTPNPPTQTPGPGTTPTIPVTLPTPAPSEPTTDPNDYWSPWPLPPRANQPVALNAQSTHHTGTIAMTSRRVGAQNDTARGFVTNVSHQQSSSSAAAAGNSDLKYRGGKVIRDLSYVNLYVSGDTEWTTSDIERIDSSLSAAMRDEHLNNVLLQYFENQPISSTALPSHPLVGYVPKTVTRGDIQNYVTYLYGRGYFRSFDLENTVVNFLLPPGTMLTDQNAAANSQQSQNTSQASETPGNLQSSETAHSLAGLGGYHGSVVTADEKRIYYSAGVYSQRSTNGNTNGVPVFGESWKNVVATLYHQLIEARTDPNVEDALRNSTDLNADRNLGWVSDDGLEIGDVLNDPNIPITNIVREVPLANGSGVVPVQLPYSNFVHGIEGPIAQPHPLPTR